MFAPDTPLTLTDVSFTTETVDENTRRIVVLKVKLRPFTAQHAEEVGVRSVLFNASTGLPKPAISKATVIIAVAEQQVTFAMAPDQGERRIVLRNVTVDPQMVVTIKHDRDPGECDATIKLTFAYPTADVLLYLASGVNDTHYLTFDSEQGDLLTTDDDTKEVIRRLAARARHGALSTR